MHKDNINTEKLLTICVPTYMREVPFEKLAKTFLNKVIRNYSHCVEIHVYDNSDAKIAERKKSVCDKNIDYHINSENVGFAGNFINCLDGKVSKFIWIISDDDDVLFEHFDGLITYLSKDKAPDLIFVPFLSSNCLGEQYINNTAEHLNLSDSGRFLEFLDTKEVPFILFSSAIIKTPTLSIRTSLKPFQKNAYVQTIAYCLTLDLCSRFSFFSKPLIKYNPGYVGQTASVRWMSDSLLEVRQFLSERFNYPFSQSMDLDNWSLWLLHHRGGQYVLHEGDADRLYFTAEILKNLSVKRFLILIALWIPTFLIRPVYLIYWTRQDMKKRYRVLGKTVNGGFLQRVKLTYDFASSLQNRVKK